MINKNITERQTSKKENFYVLFNISLLFILPLLSIFIEHVFQDAVVNWQLIGKWYIFWGVGVRLFVAGIKQTSSPQFTASIFKFTNSESNVVIRELGFANISLGAMGILSAINNNWRLIAAITSMIFFGLAALQHTLKKLDSRNEMVAMFYDLIIFLVLVFYIVFTLFF